MLFIYLFYCGSNLSHAGTRVILLKRVQQELSVVLQAQADSPGQFLQLYNVAQEHSGFWGREIHPQPVLSLLIRLPNFSYRCPFQYTQSHWDSLDLRKVDSPAGKHGSVTSASLSICYSKQNNPPGLHLYTSEGYAWIWRRLQKLMACGNMLFCLMRDQRQEELAWSTL